MMPQDAWRPPFCPDPSGCRPLIHPTTDPDNMTLDQRGYDGLSDAKVWTNDRVVRFRAVHQEQGPKGLRLDVVMGSAS